MDTTMTEDELFTALDNFLDSITAAHSFAIINTGTGNWYFNYTSAASSATKQQFQPLSLTADLKSEFSIGKFFVQPQIVLDDYLPAATNNITTTFIINTGIIL